MDLVVGFGSTRCTDRLSVESFGNDAFFEMPPTRRCYRLSSVVVSTRLGLHVDRPWLAGGVSQPRSWSDFASHSAFPLFKPPSRGNEHRKRSQLSLRKRVSVGQKSGSPESQSWGKLLSFRAGSLGTLKLKHLGIRKDCESQSNTSIAPRVTRSYATRRE
jgi:hypothetical protein